MKKLLGGLLGAAIAFTGGASVAEELSGTELHRAISGKEFECAAASHKLTLKFDAVPAKSTKFPFRYDFRGQSGKNSYKIDNKGRLRNGSDNSRRSILAGKNGGIVIKGTGVPTAKCTLR